jgi:hypothetical protein
MKLGVIGTCQHYGIAAGLRALLPAAEVVSFGVGAAPPEPAAAKRMAATLAACDAVIAHDMPARLGPIGTEALRGCAKHVQTVPTVQFAGFHPDSTRVTIDGRALAGPAGPYQSRIAVIGHLAGFSVADTVALYNRLVFVRLGYLQAYAEQSVLMAEQFAAHGIDGGRLQARWVKRGCFMYTVNHPKIFVLLDIARVACAMLDIRPEQTDVAAEHLPDHLALGPLHPVFPDIAAAAGVAPDGMYRNVFVAGAANRGLTLTAFVRESFRRFDHVDRHKLRAADGVASGMAALGLAVRPPARPPRRLERTMALLTWHGTFLRRGAPGTAPFHLPLTVPPEEQPYLTVDFPHAPRLHGFESPVLGGVEVRPGGSPAVVSLWQRARVLCPERDFDSANFTRVDAGDWEGFLPLRAADAALLQALVTHDWRIEATGEDVASVSVVPQPGFRVKFGAWDLLLLQDFPVALPPAPDGRMRVQLVLDGEPVAARAVGGIVRAPAPVPAQHLQPGQQMVAAGPMELLHLPMVLRRADRRWLYDAYAGPRPVPAGWSRYGAVLMRAADAVLRFDEGGAALPVEDPVALAAAVPVPGQSVLVTQAGPSVEAGWVEAALRLFALGPYLAPAASVLVPPGGAPGGASAGVQAAWRALGLGRRVVTAPSGPMRAADLVWLAQESTALLPGEALRAFRDRARSLVPAAPGRRIFVHGLGPAMPGDVLAQMAAAGFVVVHLAGAAPLAQAASFVGAAWVVGASGPDLAGLAFCGAGTRVVELSPPEHFSPFAWMLSAKLGLLHAVLPGWDAGRFAALVDMLGNWEA